MTTQDGGKVVSLKHRPPLPPGNTPGTHLCWRLSGPQGCSAIGRILFQWKIPMTPVGIEPATFRFVAQYLNHCVTAKPVPLSFLLASSATRCHRINVLPVPRKNIFHISHAQVFYFMCFDKRRKSTEVNWPFTDEAQTALFKDRVRTAL